MSGSTIQQVSRARSNTAGLLALFLTLSVMAQGLYFPQGWAIFGFALAGYVLLSSSTRRFNLGLGMEGNWGLTDAYLGGMFLLSLGGIVHPVKVIDGLMEALHWGIFWLVFRLGVQISRDKFAQKRLLQYMEWLGIVVAIIGWLPWMNKVGGRLSSVFGYPNATAAFLGAVLLLYPRRKFVRIILGISLLGTGSRAGVGLFLIVLLTQGLVIGVRLHRLPAFLTRRQSFYGKGSFKRQQIGRLGLSLLGIIGAALMLLQNKLIWENLFSWGFSSSSWQDRMVYFKDGLILAWNARGLPQAGGWMAFPTIQRFPYWTADPHSSFIHILLNQGVLGLIMVGIWGGYALAQVRKTWGKKQAFSSAMSESEVTKAQVRIGGALLFLVLHSLVDADFSFGALGCFFWILVGSVQKNKSGLKAKSKGMLGFSFILLIVCGSVLINPALLKQEQGWNAQALLWREKDPAKSSELWNMSLNWDQTQNDVRREQAEFLLQQGNMETGLKAVEVVLDWQPFNIAAYEWAQSVVWEAAEGERRTHPELATPLYSWVERVPQTISARMAGLLPSDRLLWQGYQNFSPSQHINLLVSYAQQRLSTLPLPET